MSKSKDYEQHYILIVTVLVIVAYGYYEDLQKNYFLRLIG